MSWFCTFKQLTTTMITTTKNSSFKSDLEDGKWAEKQFAKIAVKEFGATNLTFNESDDILELRQWDLRYNNKDNRVVTFEIKWDKLSTTTGNFAVEFFGRSSASGIDATTANYWVTLSGDKFYITPTFQLRELILNNHYRNICINNGSAYVYLIPITDIKNISRILNN